MYEYMKFFVFLDKRFSSYWETKINRNKFVEKGSLNKKPHIIYYRYPNLMDKMRDTHTDVLQIRSHLNVCFSIFMREMSVQGVLATWITHLWRIAHLFPCVVWWYVITKSYPSLHIPKQKWFSFWCLFSTHEKFSI